MIELAEWRAGLPDPDYERIFNDVHNIIIHHSAGSNSDTNYVNVIRNIYIYHTEIRGWSDIGYNYLIAQDGSIFKGRDPGYLLQDEVLGAHFCNSNTGTLGICMLGTYSEQNATQAGINSLINLITWKLGKDSLDLLGFFSHQLNERLPVIAGHRDGCSTECPGDSIYFNLNTIRQTVYNNFIECGYTITPVSSDQHHVSEIAITLDNGKLILTFNNGNNYDIVIHDITGRRMNAKSIYHATDRLIIFMDDFPDGIFFVTLLNSGIKHTFQISKSNQNH